MTRLALYTGVGQPTRVPRVGRLVLGPILGELLGGSPFARARGVFRKGESEVGRRRRLFGRSPWEISRLCRLSVVCRVNAASKSTKSTDSPKALTFASDRAQVFRRVRALYIRIETRWSGRYLRQIRGPSGRLSRLWYRTQQVAH